MSTGVDRRRPFAVFGGTGFLGRRVVSRLLRDGCRVRMVSRTPGAFDGMAGVETVVADIRDAAAVQRAVTGSGAVVNAVSLYAERNGLTFEEIHVHGARRLAEQAARASVPRLVHVSGMGSDPWSSDRYIRARGRGEAAVCEGFGAPVLLRPAPMIGAGGGLLSSLLQLVNLPVVPLFGRGDTRLAPAVAEDVAAAVAHAMQYGGPEGPYQLAGPRSYTYRELVAVVAEAKSRKPFMVPVPFPVWSGLARLAEWLPEPPLTRHQVALMRHDKVAAGKGLPALGVTPRPLEDVLENTAAGT